MVRALAILLVSAGCGVAADSEVEVRPFSEVQDSEMVFEADPTNPSRAIFRVTTTEPMICAIVWGEDDTFGNFNNSLNMAGTGIVQHDVFLPDAVPGVKYSFVVQGTTADGILYRSEVETFVISDTGTTEATGNRSANLAEAAAVQVSSEFNEAFAATNAVDGDFGTEWSSLGDADNAWIEIDLGAPAAVSGFEFLTRAMTDGTSITETYTVTVDGIETYGPFPAGNPADSQPSLITINGQVFRFDVDSSTGGNTGAVEVRILGQ
ncbi:hypothetical protein BH23ACT4_BH23ACT4_14730 [soil metagenome]